MNYTVFYSWQSDLENKFNRGFIQDVLEKAVKNVSNNKDFNLEAFVDRDTYGVPGSPSIVESITGKIAKADVFVCDVSIINKEGRLTPNPNVLFELGYASAILGWDRIIMVQNIAYGGTDKLPFDLRGRRILQYKLDSTIAERSEEKQKLQTTLVETFEDALKYYKSDYFGTKEKVIWWGKWEMETIVKVRGGQLHISRVSSDAFFFELSLFDGGRNGGVSGKAQILTPHSAYARIKTPDDDDCEIHFKRRLENNSWHIEVEQGFPCTNFQGIGTTFSGIYKHKTEALVSWGNIDEIDLNEIERLTGKYLSKFLENFQQIHVEHGEYGNDLIVVEGGVKGLYTIMESIVILNKNGTVWCACLDSEEKLEIVRYFTNEINEPKPPILSEWLSKFKDRQFIINGVISTPIENPKSRKLFSRRRGNI